MKGEDMSGIFRKQLSGFAMLPKWVMQVLNAISEIVSVREKVCQ